MPSIRYYISLVEAQNDALPRIKGTARRHELLLRARSGVRLNAEGGQAYDRDMRRLIQLGLAKIERRADQGANRNTSYLVLTDEGRDHLRGMGISPEPPAIPPAPDNVWSDEFDAWRRDIKDVQKRP